jgi:hypothetical protein
MMTKDEARQQFLEALRHDSSMGNIIAFADAYAQAHTAAAHADEWKLLDGPEFDYKKLTAEQENLYVYAFNTGSKQAWEQAKAEHKDALANTLGLLEALAKRVNFQVDLVWRTSAEHDMRTLSVTWDAGVSATPHYRYWCQDYISGEDVPEREVTRDEARALLAGEEKKE